VLKFAQLGEVLGPLFGGVGKTSVPLQMLEALVGTGRVVDLESGTFVVVHVCVWVVSVTEDGFEKRRCVRPVAMGVDKTRRERAFISHLWGTGRWP
jgi:hypothetical protein